jgi:hypothetical protein
VSYSIKYLNDMVENLAESPWMCLDGPGSAPIEIPRRGSFLEREKGREVERCLCWLGRREDSLLT